MRPNEEISAKYIEISSWWAWNLVTISIDFKIKNVVISREKGQIST